MEALLSPPILFPAGFLNKSLSLMNILQTLLVHLNVYASPPLENRATVRSQGCSSAEEPVCSGADVQMCRGAGAECVADVQVWSSADV